MSSQLLKSAKVLKPSSIRFPNALPRATSSRSYGSSTESNNEEERFFPVYTHPVSKAVLQHLQDSRSGWLAKQGLHNGLQLKSNGTFLLKFPGPKGADAGKIWTSRDPTTKKHWLSVYRNQFNAKFLLAEGTLGETENEKEGDLKTIDDKTTLLKIQSAVDQMVRLVPPPSNTKY